MDDQLANRIRRFLANGAASGANEGVGGYAVATTVGLVRSENQDAAVIVKARYGGAPLRDFDLAVVCDGLGGMRSGREAALLGLSCFVSRMIRTARVESLERVVGAIEHANMEVFKVVRGNGGTTLSSILVHRSGPTIIGHAGDSRIYAIDGTDLRQLSYDDTLEAALNKSAGQASVLRDNRLIQFVGIGKDLEPHVFPIPETEAHAFLLTSDGAHDVPHHLLRRAVVGPRQAPDLAKKLIQLSESLGGLDNATVAIIPSRLPHEEDRPSEGLDLMFLSPFGRFDVWIPQLLDDRREVLEDRRMPPIPGLRESNEDGPLLPQSENTGRSPSKSAEREKKKTYEKRKRAKKKSQKKEVVATEDNQLSLPTTSIDIEFPEQEDDK